jgi:hypothetical protein
LGDSGGRRRARNPGNYRLALEPVGVAITKARDAKIVFRTICCAVMLSISFVPRLAAANEIEGFRLGMSMRQVSQLAVEKGYKFSNSIKQSPNWTSYVLIKDGPQVSFCSDVLSSVGKSYNSNLHEFANLLTQWMTSLGEPELKVTQQYASGSPASTLRYIWSGEDNVRREISFWQYGSQNPQISFGYGYIKHPCNQGLQ